MKGKGEKEEEESKPIFTPGMIFQDVAFEQMSEGSFIEYNRLTGQTGTRSFIIHDGLEYKSIKKLPWPSVCLPPLTEESEDPLTKEQLKEKFAARRFQGEYGNSERLFDEVKEFWQRHLDVSNPLLYDVYTCFTLMTWRTEDFKVVPYLFYLGPMASGKSRALECLHALCFRSIMASSVSAAVIFRVLEAWHPTLLLDEAEVYRPGRHDRMSGSFERWLQKRASCATHGKS